MNEIIFLYLNSPYYNYKNFYFTFDNLYYHFTPNYNRKFILFLYNAKRFKNNLEILYNKYENTNIEIIDINKEDTYKELIEKYNDNNKYDYYCFIGNTYLFTKEINNINLLLNDKDECMFIKELKVYDDIIISKSKLFNKVNNIQYWELEDYYIKYLNNEKCIIHS